MNTSTTKSVPAKSAEPAKSVVFKTHMKRVRYATKSGDSVSFDHNGVLVVPAEKTKLVAELREMCASSANTVWEDASGNSEPDHITVIAAKRNTSRIDPTTGLVTGVVTTASSGIALQG